MPVSDTMAGMSGLETVGEVAGWAWARVKPFPHHPEVHPYRNAFQERYGADAHLPYDTLAVRLYEGYQDSDLIRPYGRMSVR
jgi:hypothetical protein